MPTSLSGYTFVFVSKPLSAFLITLFGDLETHIAHRNDMKISENESLDSHLVCWFYLSSVVIKYTAIVLLFLSNHILERHAARNI